MRAPESTTGTEHASGRPEATRTALLTRAVDLVTDVAVLLFAAWTLIYHVGLLLRPPTIALLCAWAGAAALIVALYVRHRSGVRRDPADGGAPPPADGGSLLALATGGGFALASLFIVNPDADDAYFVSRSVWTAEHGRIPFRDVMMTQGATPPTAGEPPVSSIEVLVGALARLCGVPAASVLWYVYLPVVTFLAVWAIWRLIRLWTSRRAAACFLTAVVYLLWTGASGASLGSFHLLRMWQGKATFVSLIVPLLYVYLTRWAEERSRAALGLAAAAGVAAAGLTSTAAFVVPLITFAAVAPLAVAGRLRTALAATVAMAYPLAAGLAVKVLSGNVEVSGRFHTGMESYSMVLLSGVLGVLCACALWISAWPARRGVPTQLVLGIAGLTTLLLVPGVLELIRDAVGAGPVLWRAMWIVPAPVLIGLLAAVPVPRRLSWAGPAPALAICAVAVLGGTAVWSAANGSQVGHRPRWKADPGRLSTARKVVAANRGGGLVLMPPSFMRNVPLFTSRSNTVNPNDHYLRMLPVARVFVDDRLVLSRLATPSGSMPAVPRVREALRRAGVTIACVRPSNAHGVDLLRRAGYREPAQVGQLICLFP
ncbi:MAG: hypothetical protein JWO67_4276 [Streptosporangiaceae bacterium]|nr:hypothetical protein [Streptosporangiaceae bacterium]